MKLCTFTHDGRARVGIVEPDGVVDLAAARPDLPTEMVAFLAAGDAALGAARAAREARGTRLHRDAVRLEAPVPRPPKFLGIGMNYADHARERGKPIPTFPVFFNKQSTCVTGPEGAIHLPRVSTAVDYEGELAFVVGRRCRRVTRDRAREVIAGFTIVDDVSVRDYQDRAPTMTLGKSFDTHGPMGPYIVTPDELGDPHVLDLRTFVNGEQRQASNTSNLIFDCYAQIEWLSSVFTLEPGDVISTGTPSGVGVAMTPPRFLVAGDVVRIEIDGIGHLENRVIAEPD